jgi:hypothetical protein
VQQKPQGSIAIFPILAASSGMEESDPYYCRPGTIEVMLVTASGDIPIVKSSCAAILEASKRYPVG